MSVTVHEGLTSALPAVRHACPHCDHFWVDEPAPQMSTDWTDDGRLTMKVTRYGWELPMVQHWYEDHSDMYRLVFRDLPISGALLQVAAEAKRTLQQMLDRQMRNLGGR